MGHTKDTITELGTAVVEGRSRGKIATRKDWAHALVLPEWVDWILEKKEKEKRKRKQALVERGLEASQVTVIIIMEYEVRSMAFAR